MNVAYPPLLIKYLKIYQDDPTSRIFAPLAECYRKIGLVDEAIEICKEGLSIHPDFVSGKVALARAYFDKKMFAQVRNVLHPIIEKIPDNIIAQKLMGDACLHLGYLHEAVNAYKVLLYFNPNDNGVFEIVQEIETKIYEKGGLLKVDKRPDKVRKIMKLQEMLAKAQRAQGIIV